MRPSRSSEELGMLALEGENARLKELLAEQVLENPT